MGIWRPNQPQNSTGAPIGGADSGDYDVDGPPSHGGDDGGGHQNPNQPSLPQPNDPTNPGGPPVVDGPMPPPAPPAPPVDTGAPDASRWIPGAPGVGMPGSPTGTGLDATIEAEILRILQQGEVNENDPSLVNLRNVHRVAGQRSFDRNRAQLAERAAARGISGSGGFETGLQGLAQQRGESEQAFAADTMRQAQTERAGQIMQALTLGQGRINSQTEVALQRELASIQAAIAAADREQRGSQFDRSMDYDWLRLLMEGAA